MGLTGKFFEQGEGGIDNVAVPRTFSSGDVRRYAEQAAAQFMNEYGNLLSCYTLGGEFGLWQTLQTYLVTMGLGDEVTAAVQGGDVAAYTRAIFAAQVGAFATLAKRGALERLMIVESLPELASEELSKLFKYASASAKTSSAAPVVPQPAALTPTEICANDWKELSSGAFQKKYMANQNGRKIYEQALAEGKI
jgi:hypothetical protein